MTKFTNDQMANWMSYEEVRLSGEYNMMDSNARESSGLTEEEYLFVMMNYTELKSVYSK